MTEKRDLKEQEQAPEAGAMPAELEATVRRLAETLSPVEPPQHLRQRIRRQVRAEWDAVHAPWWAPLAEMWRDVQRGLTRRPAWGALAALLVMGLLVTLLVPGGGDVAGTVVAPVADFWWMLIPVALIAAAGLLWWRNRR